MNLKETFSLKQQIPVTKVIGLILSWDLIVLLGGWIKWGNLNDGVFYSFIWLNFYLLITILNVKKTGLALFFSEVFNTIYDDTLDERAKLNKAKESLALAANFLSLKDIELLHKESTKNKENTVAEIADSIIDTL